MSLRAKSFFLTLGMWLLAPTIALFVLIGLRDFLGLQTGGYLTAALAFAGSLLAWRLLVPRLFPSDCPKCSERQFFCTSFAPRYQGFRCRNCGYTIDLVKEAARRNP